jgi:ankyrin repeat protein
MGFWEKVELLAIAEYTQQPLAPVEQLGIPQSTTTVVHALLGLKHCPPPVLEFACFLMPHALLQKDDHGDLPLHIAARNSCDDMIQDILEAQPLAAAVPDATGSLPLQLYVGRRHVPSWNALMKAFIVAFPSAVEHLDLDRRLYPLLWSRLNRRRPSMCNPSEDLDSLFLSIQSALDTLIVVS